MDTESGNHAYDAAQSIDISQAIARSSSELAALVEEALRSHEPHDVDEECRFEEATQELLRVLNAYSDALMPDEAFS
jgi:hypothetical protein